MKICDINNFEQSLIRFFMILFWTKFSNKIIFKHYNNNWFINFSYHFFWNRYFLLIHFEYPLRGRLLLIHLRNQGHSCWPLVIDKETFLCLIANLLHAQRLPRNKRKNTLLMVPSFSMVMNISSWWSSPL